MMKGWILVWAMCVLPGAAAPASEESVDRLTQAALDLDAHPQLGAAVYRQSCARCHGAQAQGDGSAAIPALAAQRFRYLVRQLANFAGQERDGATMQRVLAGHGGLQAPQTWVDVAAYLNNLPMKAPAGTGTGARVALGRGIFHEQCAACHHADGHGDDEGFVPSLRNQQYTYLASQLVKLADGSRHNVDEDLVRFWRSLDEDDVLATADYLSRLRGPGEVHKIMRRDGTVVD
ncbi:MAG TPA: c-type cytochrome [Steroidobacteraceae bacterium]|nr:c-type cytochrome [Steroidobacteraceae bacterium]